MSIKYYIPKSMHALLRKGLFGALRHSLTGAAREQNLYALAQKLTTIVPDIGDQYSTFKVDAYFSNEKLRYQHAFQISLVERVIGEFSEPTIVDIGDSAGTHIRYLAGLHPDVVMRCLSVNLDPKAVEKIKAKGLEAIHARAEELDRYNIAADIFMCFETVEHLLSPSEFFHALSSKTNAKYLVITVPYVAQSRVGLHHIRHGRREGIGAETTHIFELSPEDLTLLVQHSGWRVAYEQIYLQYPKHGLMYITKPWWKRFDFEGFYGMILVRDDSWSSLYKDW